MSGPALGTPSEAQSRLRSPSFRVICFRVHAKMSVRISLYCGLRKSPKGERNHLTPRKILMRSPRGSPRASPRDHPRGSHVPDHKYKQIHTHLSKDMKANDLNGWGCLHASDQPVEPQGLENKHVVVLVSLCVLVL
jgi:hypothetical protein